MERRARPLKAATASHNGHVAVYFEIFANPMDHIRVVWNINVCVVQG